MNAERDTALDSVTQQRNSDLKIEDSFTSKESPHRLHTNANFLLAQRNVPHSFLTI
jgi:hypothetical protein